jgi:predicted ribosome quality control (RQC) complex YloA/Tae2 family protein
MAYDALTLRAIIHELKSELTGGRVMKIFQPTRFEISLLIHAAGKNRRLLASAHPQHGSLYITSENPENPTTPPMFCMLLRKHLEGGRILDIRQYELERVAVLDIAAEDETGHPVRLSLIVEVMGKHSNIILINQQTGLIIDSIRRINHRISRLREVLPGTQYQWPPPQNRIDPLNCTEDSFLNQLDQRPSTERLDKSLVGAFEGIGPLSAREIVARSGLDSESRSAVTTLPDKSRLWQAFTSFFADMDQHLYQPHLAVEVNQHKVLAYAPYPMVQYPLDWQTSFPTMNALLDYYFIHWSQTDRQEEFRNQLLRITQNAMERCINRISIAEESLLDSEKADTLRAYGEIILANMHHIQKGDPAVTGYDYRTNPDQPITVILDPQMTPQENAQAYFKRYTKTKNSVHHLEEQKSSAKKELAYLESIELSIREATTTAILQEIRDELTEAGYVKEVKNRTRKKKASSALSKPIEISVGSDARILIGRNNRQNDLLTMKLARPDDLWFHAKDIPGAHVILTHRQQGEIPSALMELAASYAAFHSQAKLASKVPVDYTKRRYVRKPVGARLGMVIYDHQKTLIVTPCDPAMDAKEGTR